MAAQHMRRPRHAGSPGAHLEAPVARDCAAPARLILPEPPVQLCCLRLLQQCSRAGRSKSAAHKYNNTKMSSNTTRENMAGLDGPTGTRRTSMIVTGPV